jgi:hypothetical protein
MNPVFFALFFKDFFISTSSPPVSIHLFFAFMILHPVSGLTSPSSSFSYSFILGLLIPTCFPITFGLSSIIATLRLFLSPVPYERQFTIPLC